MYRTHLPRRFHQELQKELQNAKMTVEEKEDGEDTGWRRPARQKMISDPVSLIRELGNEQPQRPSQLPGRPGAGWGLRGPALPYPRAHGCAWTRSVEPC